VLGHSAQRVALSVQSSGDALRPVGAATGHLLVNACMNP